MVALVVDSSPNRMSTKERRKALRKLLLAGKGRSQAELCDLLAERGFRTTQSTVSRDLKLLGARRRVDEEGELVYLLEQPTTPRFPAEMVLLVEHNETSVVMRTRVGRAPAVGIELDGLRHPDILATVAGDDTVIVVPRTITRVSALTRSLRELSELDPDTGR